MSETKHSPESAGRTFACLRACEGFSTSALEAGRLTQALGLLENIARAVVNENDAAGMAKQAFTALRALGRLP